MASTAKAENINLKHSDDSNKEGKDAGASGFECKSRGNSDKLIEDDDVEYYRERLKMWERVWEEKFVKH